MESDRKHKKCASQFTQRSIFRIGSVNINYVLGTSIVTIIVSFFDDHVVCYKK